MSRREMQKRCSGAGDTPISPLHDRAELIARQLFDAGLEGEELYAAMWAEHDRTGIEPRILFTEYKLLGIEPAA